MQKVVLVGYMGSGKSIIGKLLSEKTELTFLDLDEIIEQKENCTIKSVFETKGEIYFRKIEHSIFKEVIQNKNSFILSLGGGTPCYANNHEMLKNENVTSIYLNASIETLYNRLILEKSKRPIIANQNQEELKEFIAKHLFDRSFYYNQSNHKINVNNKSADEIVTEIEKLLI
jgi:shikimate kinase